MFKGINLGQKDTGSLGSGQISRIYERLAKQAGFSKDRWSKIDTVMRYVEHINYVND